MASDSLTFAGDAKTAVQFATQYAQHANHCELRTIHLWAASIEILRSNGQLHVDANREDLVKSICRLIPEGESRFTSGPFPKTAEYQNVLIASLANAESENVTHISLTHIVISLIQHVSEPDSLFLASIPLDFNELGRCLELPSGG